MSVSSVTKSRDGHILWFCVLRDANPTYFQWRGWIVAGCISGCKKAPTKVRTWINILIWMRFIRFKLLELEVLTFILPLGKPGHKISSYATGLLPNFFAREGSTRVLWLRTFIPTMVLFGDDISHRRHHMLVWWWPFLRASERDPSTSFHIFYFTFNCLL